MPFKIPERVVEPVPPLATVRAVVRERVLAEMPEVNVWSWFHEFVVVVPNAREKVRPVVRSPPPISG